jgi:hypothetical protein
VTDPTWLVEVEGNLTDEAQAALGEAGITVVGATGRIATPANRHYVWASAPSADEAARKVSGALESCGSFFAFNAGPADNGPDQNATT